MAAGACIYFAEKDALRGTLVRAMLAARPTLFFSTAAVWEQIGAKLRRAAAKSKAKHKAKIKAQRSSRTISGGTGSRGKGWRGFLGSSSKSNSSGGGEGAVGGALASSVVRFLGDLGKSSRAFLGLSPGVAEEEEQVSASR